MAYPMMRFAASSPAAAERPTIDDFLFGVHLPNHRDGNAKQLRPI
ncbi:hypothetical protein [Bradyrhizobium sp. ERR14]|nr:hypothetical protein [Bradyrhizobium sp. ERR14]MBB4393439.1 hypothetical protein [Bradyrhizobium sp. ERR14]